MSGSRLLAVIAALAVTNLDAARANSIAFIGCPVLRDIEAPEPPCWLASDGKNLYFLGLPASTIPPVPFYSPQLKHRVLVEGELAGNGEQACGGIRLSNVKVSVFPEIDPACQTILPQGDFHPPKPPRDEPPWRKGMLAATGPLPERFGQVMPGRPAPTLAPFASKTFRIDYAFNEDFLYVEDGMILAEVAWYFEDLKTAKIKIVSHRDRTSLSDGQTIVEDENVPLRRAERLKSVLIEWGIPESNLSIQSDRTPTSQGRYADLIVQPLTP